ncbi:HD-GYP domain-containing protein [Deinococcus malanensis]|uniref:HD-GYP domain-containing protein n=1 Tax=Deinococcus malanensis TaxID=1706855 RepID=UPI0036393915
MGVQLGLTPEHVSALRQGAYLHDVGKSALPDDQLLKPQPCTAGERPSRRDHTVRGYVLARQLPGLDPLALEVVRSHHERWDGAGYPDGMVGERIPC